MRRLGLVLLLVGCVAGFATAQQTNCRSYYVGNILYTSCDGQPGRPATNCRSYYVGNILYTSCDGQPGRPAVPQPSGGIDATIYGKQNPPPKMEGPLDIMLKAEALKNLRLQNEAAAAARASAANPAPIAAVPPPGTPAASEALAADQLLAELDGSWWLGVRRLADKGDNIALMSRLTVVRGILAGFDMSLIMQSSSIEDYNQRRAKTFRSDLTFEQIMAKVDGYYAEPSQVETPLGLAVILAVKPIEKQ